MLKLIFIVQLIYLPCFLEIRDEDPGIFEKDSS